MGYFDDESDSESLKDKSVRGTGLQTASKIVTTITALVSTAILARLLTPEDYGLKAMAGAVVGFIGIFNNLSLSKPIIERDDLKPKQVSTLFWINVGISIFFILLAAAIAPVAVWFYGDGRLFAIIPVMSLSILLSGLHHQHTALLRRNMMFRPIVLGGVSQKICASLVAIVLAYLSFGYWAIVIGPLAGNVAIGVVAWWACTWRPKGFEFTSDIKSMLKFGMNMSVSQLVSFINRNLDDVLLGRWAGAKALGLYNRAYTLFQYPMRSIQGPISYVAFPLLSRLTDDPERYRDTYYRILDKILLATIPIATMVAATPDLIVLIILGDQWTGAAPILGVFGLCLLYQPVGRTTGFLFTSQDRSDVAVRFSIFIGAPTMITSFLVGLPWGAIGIAVAYSLSGFFITFPISMWMACRNGPTNFKSVLGLMAPYAAVAVTVTGCLWLLRWKWTIQSPFVGLVTYGTICCAMVAGLFFLLERPRSAMYDAKNLIFEQIF